MSMLDDEQTHVRDLVTENPRRANVFDKYQINYCCGGKMSLREACEKNGVDETVLRKELHEIDHGTREEFDLKGASLSELVEHIESMHHCYMREEMPAIDKLMEKVVTRHGENHPELKKLQEIFHILSSDIAEHLLKEENILFPWIRQLDSGADLSNAQCGSIQNPIGVMEQEHDAAEGFLLELRTVSSAYTPHAEACNSFRVLYQKLADMEVDMHRHIHKENQVLFPKALEKERQLS